MAADASLPWKLYHNPHFLSDSLHDSPHLLLAYETPTSPLRPNPLSTVMDDLALALAEISELRAEVDLERRMRRAAESLAKSVARELADERRARADAEAEMARCREAADRAVREADEDRRMLKLAEAWREERVKMKLAHAAIVLEERIQEVASNVIMQKTSEVDCVAAAARNGRERQGREIENPHIRRGINGFVEFSRAFRVRSPGLGRDRGGGDLECERAHLRVLMK
ncbi:hypothetical protein KFK09_012004 [Dendrobium nobile]|uniref:Uncharacterized protein n=1 Tax=Dendrobium nobile TaxID=94219 RepID=A0A8T3BG43_DENNO|nr:hypothetical protein KFK09_012004 [Dendrobium nobile]